MSDDTNETKSNTPQKDNHKDSPWVDSSKLVGFAVIIHKMKEAADQDKVQTGTRGGSTDNNGKADSNSGLPISSTDTVHRLLVSAVVTACDAQNIHLMRGATSGSVSSLTLNKYRKRAIKDLRTMNDSLPEEQRNPKIANLIHSLHHILFTKSFAPGSDRKLGDDSWGDNKKIDFLNKLADKL